MRTAALAILALLAAASARAETVSERPDSIALTIYRDRPGSTADITDPGARPAGLALVVETRTIDVPAEGGRIALRGVAAGIVPQSARIEGLPAEIVERNFDYDLLSPGALLEKSVGRTVRVVRTDRATGKVTDQAAVVRSAPDGVVLEISGRIEALRCGGLPERLVFDAIPPGLSDRPTLSVLARAGAPGRYKVRLSYLATGFDWSADYVASIRPDGRSLDLSGWITLVNRTSASFADAPTQVVAGRWARVDDDGTDAGPIEATALALGCWPTGSWGRSGTDKFAPPPPPPPPPALVMAAPMAMKVEDLMNRLPQALATVSDLGDYKLYSLPEPTTVAARQVKQVGLVDRRDVPFERVYGFTVSRDNSGQPEERAPASVLLRLQNKAASHLGLSLPSGSMSVREPDPRGDLMFAGEDKLDDAPAGLPFEVKLGRAADVGVQTRKVSDETLGGKPRRHRVAMEVAVSNDKPVAIVFELRHAVERRGFRIGSESRRHATKGSDPLWTLALAPGARETVRYTYDEDD